mmetsp:Transcript_1580/g.3052  ORF Transcript_1580/g.3052 Transcript_1580/m.3052 type:complete len:207 (-) Transcript_1580:125-745(-)
MIVLCAFRRQWLGIFRICIPFCFQRIQLIQIGLRQLFRCAHREMCSRRRHSEDLTILGRVVIVMRDWLARIIILPSPSGTIIVRLHPLTLGTLKLCAALRHRTLVVQSNQCRVLVHGRLVQFVLFRAVRVFGREIKTMSQKSVDRDLVGVVQRALQDTTVVSVPVQLHCLARLVLKDHLQRVWMFGLFYRIVISSVHGCAVHIDFY